MTEMDYFDGDSQFDDVDLEQKDTKYVEKTDQNQSSEFHQLTQSQPLQNQQEEEEENKKVDYEDPFVFDYQGQAKKRIISIEYTIKSEYTAFIESICYEVKSEINGIFNRVFRTYSHFEWLYLALKNQFMGMIVPSIPPKNLLARVNISQSQTQAIRDQRQWSLLEFLNRVVEHPTLSQSDNVTIFFEKSEQIIHEEMIKIEQCNKNYVHQASSLIYSTGNTVSSIAQISFKYFGSYLGFTEKQAQYPNSGMTLPSLCDDQYKQDSEFFDTWSEILIMERDKLIIIKENFLQMTLCKLDQTCYLSVINNNVRAFGQEDQVLKKFSESVSAQQQYQLQQYNKIQQKVCYPLELYVQDFQQALDLIQERNKLIVRINELVSDYNLHRLANSQYITVAEEIKVKTTLLKQMVLRQKKDLPNFFKSLNKQISSVIELYYQLIKDLVIHVKIQYQIQMNDVWTN